jgi:hypothetical protein
MRTTISSTLTSTLHGPLSPVTLITSWGLGGVNRRFGMSLFQVLQRAQVFVHGFRVGDPIGTFPMVDYQLALLACPRSGSKSVYLYLGREDGGLRTRRNINLPNFNPQTTASHCRTEEGGQVYFQGRVSITTSIEARQQQHQPRKT